MSKSQMVKVAKDFQSSVNIAYDLHDEKKIINFIATNEQLNYLKKYLVAQMILQQNEHIFLSVHMEKESLIVLKYQSSFRKR